MSDFIKDKFNPYNSLQLFGYDKLFNDFIILYKQNKLPKVILLSGEKGLGKFTFIFHLLNYIFSLKESGYDIKNFKINPENYYYKRILNNIFENLVYINNAGQNKTSIEDIRKIKNKLGSVPLSNIPRFTVIDDVERLNISAANALLKIIEEPSDVNYFILINNKNNLILETLKSRSIETKIFLNRSQQEYIINNLINTHNLNPDYLLKFKKYTTPGMLILFSEICSNLNLDIDMSLYQKTSLLLDEFKKNRNDIFLECIKFMIDINLYSQIDKKTLNIINVCNKKDQLIKLINQYRNFNLNKNTVLEYFKTSPDYA